MLRRALSNVLATNQFAWIASSSSSRVLDAAAGGSSTISSRAVSTTPRALHAAAQVTASTEAERAIAAKIAGGLPGAAAVRVEDTSGGCGTMYAIEVTAAEFAGVSKIKQHQAVARILADDVKQWHGFQLVTKAP
jgi:stress-induced morphogen